MEVNKVTVEGIAYLRHDPFVLPTGLRVLGNFNSTGFELDYFGTKLQIGISKGDGSYYLKNYRDPVTTIFKHFDHLLSSTSEGDVKLFWNSIKLIHGIGVSSLRRTFQELVPLIMPYEITSHASNFLESNRVYKIGKGQSLIRITYLRKYSVWIGYDYSRSMYLFEMSGNETLDPNKVIATEDLAGCVSDAVQYAISFGK